MGCDVEGDRHGSCWVGGRLGSWEEVAVRMDESWSYGAVPDHRAQSQSCGERWLEKIL